MLFIPCPQVLLMGKKIDPTELDFLLRYPAVLNVTSPVEFLSHGSWGGIKALSNMEQFRNLDKDIEVYYTYMHTIANLHTSDTPGNENISLNQLL